MMVREGPIELPDLEHCSDTPIFNTKAVVQQTGVPAPTLRAWERRYTLLSPERADNTYRLYSERDIVLIRWLKECVNSGMAISHAIAFFRHKLSEARSNDEPDSQQHPSQTVSDSPAAFQIRAEQPHSASGPAQEIRGNQRDAIDEFSLHDWLPLLADYPHRADPAIQHNMHVIRDRLVEAFNQLDEAMANMIMRSILVIYPVEQVCTELITPTLWRIGQLWVEGQLTVSIEHFASNFFRALLTNLFHVTTSTSSGPVAIICCAPGELHELGSLMLALFLRRRGIHVVYLGQNIEIGGMLHIVRKFAPDLICISLTMPTYLSGIIDLGHRLEEMPPPRPIFAFGGQAFTQYMSLIPQIPGIYLTGDLQVVTEQLHRMLLERTENRN